MGYQIVYEDFAPKRRKTGARALRFAGLVAAFLLIFVLLTCAYWPDGRGKLQEIFLPGDPEITGQAVTVLVDDLRAGENLHDAVTAFCREILEHGENPD